LGGLGLVVVGAALLVADASRIDRSELQETLRELLASRQLSTDASGHAEDDVVVGTDSYHRPTCRLVRERTGLEHASAAQAVERGLSPCRVCHPE
jgi:hypothetical protein